MKRWGSKTEKEGRKASEGGVIEKVPVGLGLCFWVHQMLRGVPLRLGLEVSHQLPEQASGVSEEVLRQRGTEGGGWQTQCLGKKPSLSTVCT